MSNRDELRSRGQAVSRCFITITVPSGGECRFQTVTRSEQRAWRKSFAKKGGGLDLVKAEFMDDVMLALSWVDEDNQPVLTRDEALGGFFDDFTLADTNAMVSAVRKLNRMDDDDEDLDDVVKNSQATSGNDSSGDSADATT